MGVLNRFWKWKKWTTDRLWEASRVVRGSYPNVLFVTEQNRISASQIYPFYFFRKVLDRELGFDFREVSIREYETRPLAPENGAEVVFFQPWWNIEPDRLRTLLEKIRNENPEAKVIFLDSYAPLDLRLAQYLDSSVDISSVRLNIE